MVSAASSIGFSASWAISFSDLNKGRGGGGGGLLVSNVGVGGGGKRRPKVEENEGVEEEEVEVGIGGGGRLRRGSGVGGSEDGEEFLVGIDGSGDPEAPIDGEEFPELGVGVETPVTEIPPPAAEIRFSLTLAPGTKHGAVSRCSKPSWL